MNERRVSAASDRCIIPDYKSSRCRRRQSVVRYKPRGVTAMMWLIAIICIILAVVCWRRFPPVAILAAYALIVLFVVHPRSEHNRNELQGKTAEAPQPTIVTAKASTGAIVRLWQVSSERDPVSEAKMPRTASVLSDDGLCRLVVEQHIDARQTVGVYCPTLTLSLRRDIDVKFDDRPTSDTMRVERFSDGSDIYISRHQDSYSLPYHEFLRRLALANKVAFLLNAENADKNWRT